MVQKSVLVLKNGFIASLHILFTVSGSRCILVAFIIIAVAFSGCVMNGSTSASSTPSQVTPTQTSFVIVENVEEVPAPVLTSVTTSAITPEPTIPPVAELEIGKRKQSYPYTTRSQSQFLYYDIYVGVNSYLQERYPNRPTDFYNTASLEGYYRQYVSDPVQKKYLDDLIENIRDRSDLPQERARIAISLIQHIPYTVTSHTYYPYEVLSYNSGKCEDKSILAAYVLSQMGYGTALLLYYPEHHMALGLKCPKQFSINNSGYCFVETTTPTIMTFNNGTYTGVGRLTSQPEIIRISDGNSFETIEEEYTDAKSLDTVLKSAVVNSTGISLDLINYNQLAYLNKKYGLFDSGSFSGYVRPS